MALLHFGVNTSTSLLRGIGRRTAPLAPYADTMSYVQRRILVGTNPDHQTVVSDSHWEAIQNRDVGRDGEFVFAVVTTRVYCRPSCPARRPRRENVVIFSSGGEASTSGFRACKRCNPDGPSAAERSAVVVQTVCREIESARRPPKLADLARLVALSPSRLHQVFREALGITPWAYASSVRADRFRQALDASSGVATAAFEAGHGSVSGAYRHAARYLGSTPGRHQTRGRGREIAIATMPCTLGIAGIALTPLGVAAVVLGDTEAHVQSQLVERFANATFVALVERQMDLVAQVVGAIERPGISRHIPLDIRGTAFQLLVWEAVSRIRPGATMTYAEVARQIGAPSSARAVAQACAANPMAVVIPCHRVVGSVGSQGGYRWGAGRKQVLQERERNERP